MAITLDSRPPEWGGCNRRLVYTFTTTGGPFTNYRIEAQIYRSPENTPVDPKFSFSPINNITEVDVSEIIKAQLSHEWVMPGAINVIDNEIRLRYHLRYQELYDGSATSIIADSANSQQAILGTLQIPNKNDYRDPAILDPGYVPGDSTKKFLSVLESGKIWKGYPQTLSFLWAEGLIFRMHHREFNANGSLINELYLNLITHDRTVDRYLIVNSSVGELLAATTKLILRLVTSANGPEILSNPGFTSVLDPWANEAGPGPDWTYNAGAGQAEVQMTGVQDSDYLSQGITPQSAGWYNIAFNADSNGATLIIEVWNSAALVNQIINQIISAPTGGGLLVNIVGSFNVIKIRIKSTITGLFTVTNCSLKAYTPTLQSKEFTFDVKEACENPVMLFWKDSLGGDAFWLFEHGQEAGYNYSGSKKAKRMTLFAEHLTLNEWEALNELNTLGEVYANRITDSSIKSHTRDGAQVYIIDTSGNKTGVIVIPTNSVINTKDEVHSIEIEIEFPERI